MTVHAWQLSNYEAMGTCRVSREVLACFPVGGGITYVQSSSASNMS